MKSLVFGAVSLAMVSAQGEVRLFGPGGKRLDQMIENHVKATDIESISSVFLSKNECHGWWQTEFWGKYMHSAVPFREYTGDAALAAKIDKGLDNVLASQEPSGYIGNYPEELRCNEGWDVWGMKYTMMGLMHYYDGANGSERGKKALDAAMKVCDYVILCWASWSASVRRGTVRLSSRRCFRRTGRICASRASAGAGTTSRSSGTATARVTASARAFSSFGTAPSCHARTCRGARK